MLGEIRVPIVGEISSIWEMQLKMDIIIFSFLMQTLIAETFYMK